MEEDKKEIEKHNYEYDLIVIGGGSGGLACSKEAAKNGARAALFDFVKPSPHGTTWGLGGTCVNVGCIPKKLMHQAAILGEAIEDSHAFGWDNDSAPKHSWNKMMDGIQNYVKSLNWGYEDLLKDTGVTYYNMYAVFVDPHTIEADDGQGKKRTFTANRFVVAPGGRPHYGGFPGSEHCYSSDDIFWMKDPPGQKVLMIGASYVALENAGFMTGFGIDTTVMVRSILLRGFDQDMAEKIGEFMANHGTKFIRPATPTKIEKSEKEGKAQYKVTWNNEETSEESSDTFDCVFLAIGRDAETKKLNVEKAGVKLNPKNNKIAGRDETSNVPHIHAIGDIYEDEQWGRAFELTPVAIKAGVLLAKRLYGGSTTKMDYNFIPTTVFTPIEYGCVGLSEEEAIEKYGETRIEVWHSNYKPLEWTVPDRLGKVCYVKIICDKENDNKVLGYHVLGPHSGEITQGFALALKKGVTKEDFDLLVGIHPTQAEEVTTLVTTKGSGESAMKTGC
eukprot:TRINITY_DN4745_c0_g1_i1.p1 TRINITY_DN4745_c0_g1~~TRINITY_DN4745_c0_g1_i1.p1  ORF type:complete len:545 (-),score=122.51 TRINITY_DN4745_c0_g1_i1:356-1867(-)